MRSERGQNVSIVIVGNKSDLNESRSVLFNLIFGRKVSKEEGEEKSKKLGCLFIEASAKNGNNVKELFEKIAISLPGIGDVPAETLSQCTFLLS